MGKGPRVVQLEDWDDTLSHTLETKPLLRGWLHAVAAVASVGVTTGLLMETHGHLQRLIALLIFGLSMITLYSFSALYHLGRWNGRRAIVLHTLDRASIFLLIAGTYTPFCMIVLDGVLRVTMLALIWGMAVAGAGSAIFTRRLPRWVTTLLYLGMGWISLIAAPPIVRALPPTAVGLLVTGGLLYTIGAVIYALRRPNPWPRVFGFHEIFHIFVVGGSAAFLIVIWGWVVPFAQG